MARKDLSRTVIEGGRAYRNSWERRASHGITRARTREWLDHLDDDEAEGSAPRPGPCVGKSFHDKLGPARRWLEAQVGRPWARVYSELCARFDTRTVPGYHVVHGHMLGWVARDNNLTWTRRQDFFVDAHGILRRDRWAGAWRRLRREVVELAKGRRAALTFRGWWWFRRAPFGEACLVVPRWQCKEKHHFAIGDRTYHASRFVWDAPITRGELRRIDRLPPELRDSIVLRNAKDLDGSGPGLPGRTRR